MLKRHVIASLIYLFAGSVGLHLTTLEGTVPVPTGYSRSFPPENARDQLNDQSYPYHHDYRLGDWDYHQNWRYDQGAFLRGETQPQYYRERHPYGLPGIGFDGDANAREANKNLPYNSSSSYYHQQPSSTNQGYYSSSSPNAGYSVNYGQDSQVANDRGNRVKRDSRQERKERRENSFNSSSGTF